MRVKILIPATRAYVEKGPRGPLDKTEKTLGGPYDAWMYLGNPDYWMPLLRSGTKMTSRNKDWDVEHKIIHSKGVFSPADHFKPKNSLLSEYYYFVNRDNVSQRNTGSTDS